MPHERVLLVDSNDDFLDGLTDWIDGSGQLRVVGRAHTADEALARIERLAPELVVMNVTVAGASGFNLTREIKSRPKAPAVVLMSLHGSEVLRAQALNAGADGWLAQTDVARELLAVLESALSGPPHRPLACPTDRVASPTDRGRP